mmetsp:Transcript_24253/g.53890  ORF Transcript_24253/g.53890 Transcript_24253/m.53890 type:complete len:280 (+) Transcript_24253:104-943(+)
MRARALKGSVSRDFCSQGIRHLFGGGHGVAANASLRSNHLDDSLFELGNVARCCILDQDALIAAVICLAHRRLDADLGRDSTENEMAHVSGAEDIVQSSEKEGALSRLFDDNFAINRLGLIHKIVARRPVHQQPAHALLHHLSDPEPRRRATRPLALHGAAVPEVLPMRLLRVQHGQCGAPRCGKQRGSAGETLSAQLAHIVAQAVPKTALIEEILLEVNADQSRRSQWQRHRMRLGCRQHSLWAVQLWCHSKMLLRIAGRLCHWTRRKKKIWLEARPT